MAASRAISPQAAGPAKLSLTPLAKFSRMRALAWQDHVLYASRGYTLLCANVNAGKISWEQLGHWKPAWWRNLTASSRLTFRLLRDGFHALAVLPGGDLVAAVAGAIVTLAPGESEFRLSHRITRGTRPLHFAVTHDGHVFWGEYFDNPARSEVHIYVSTDRGQRWEIAYTFPRCAIRHVHNIVYGEWENCLWVLTGDNGPECRVLRASCDFTKVDTVLEGNQQARAVALVPTPDALYFSSDTPFERNHIYRIDRRGNLSQVAGLSSSSIYGCRVGDTIFFSTMVEPSATNTEPIVGVYASPDGATWERPLHWSKDRWSMRFFQYGNAFLPDGRNTSGVLAVSTVAVKGADLDTTLWRVDL